MRRKRARFPYSLLPAVLLLLGAGLFLSKGCRPGAGSTLGLPGAENASDRSAEYFAQAIAAIGTGDSRNAQKFLMSAVDERAQGATLGEAYASVSHELIQRGHATEAVNLLDPAARDPNTSWSPILWFSLADACRSAGDQARAAAAATSAEDAAKKIARSAPPAATATREAKSAAADRYLQLAAYDIVRNDARGAIDPYKTALRLLPNDPRIMNSLGVLLADVGTTDAEFGEAVKLTRAAVASAPEYGMFLDSYGWALYKTRDLNAALHVLTEAVADEPGEPEIHFHLGNVFAARGQIDDAAREFSRALLLRPDYPAATEAKSLLTAPAKPSAPSAAPPESGR